MRENYKLIDFKYAHTRCFDHLDQSLGFTLLSFSRSVEDEAVGAQILTSESKPLVAKKGPQGWGSSTFIWKVNNNLKIPFTLFDRCSPSRSHLKGMERTPKNL